MSWRGTAARHPEAISLDRDDTIVDWSGSLSVAWKSLCNRRSESVDARTLNAVVANDLMGEPGRNDTNVFLLRRLHGVRIRPPALAL